MVRRAPKFVEEAKARRWAARAMMGMAMARRGLAVMAPYAMAILVVAVMSFGFAPASLADIDPDGIDAEEKLEAAEKELRRDQDKLDRVDKKLNRLNQERSDIKFRKRTGDPFQPERTLRQDLRRNEAKQGWYKHESRRLDFKVRRQQRQLRQGSHP